MKRINKKLIATIFILIIVIVIAINSLLPRGIEDALFDINIVNNVQFNSNMVEINGNEYGVFAFLNEGTEKNEFVITVLENKGVLNNKTEIKSYSSQIDEYLINPKLENIVDFPEQEIKNGSKYYGSIYYGIAPLNCSSIIINNNEAILNHMTFELNGKTVDFQLYYCIVKENEYPDSAELICEDTNGGRYQIKTVDGAEHSQVIEINS